MNFKYEIVDQVGTDTEEYVYVMEDVRSDSEASVALCTLSAINWGLIKSPADFEKPAELAVRALDALLDYQDYPVAAAYNATMDRRPLGVGIINLAYWLAKNGLTYQGIDEAGLNKVHEYTEAWSYYLIKASIDLAKEKGPCPLWRQTKYGHGIMPIHTYKRDVDGLAEPIYRYDWEALAEEAKIHGIRNSTLTALMPAETSAQISNATNGIEPPRALVSIKQSKDGVLKQVVPEIKKLKNKYDLLWDQKSPEGYLKICSILQKFTDQSASVNTSYNPTFYENEEIPMSELLRHLVLCYKWGLKTLYYSNTFDNANRYEDAADAKAGNVQELPREEVDNETCDGCTI